MRLVLPTVIFALGIITTPFVPTLVAYVIGVACGYAIIFVGVYYET